MKAYKILAVDDEVEILELYKGMIQEHRVVVATSVKEALFKVSNERFDLIITDFKMPKRDGADLIKDVRAQEEKSGAAQTPFLMISGFLDTIQSRLVQEMNCDTLPKPFSANDLNNRVNALLNKTKSTINEDKILKINVGEGVTLIKKGHRSKKIFWILSGKVGIFDDDGKLLTTLGEDQIAGEMSILEDTPSLNDVRTIEKCELVCVDIELFNSFFKKQPQWFKLLVVDLSRKLRETSSKLWE